ncbi:MAG: TetR/AcrR family transcriptional regulator [SAR324 cluster bacterium]|nr:TetR/AcrR family transcriptional regulator [SAR324 cluster bacterium]
MKRKEEIIRRATEVFERKGVSGASFEDIAEAVGIKREGLYYYFRDRAAILVEITLEPSRKLLNGLQNIIDSNQTFRDKLRLALENHLDRFDPNYLEMAVALREHHIYETNDEMEALRQVWKEYSDLWVALIRNGQAEGTFQSGQNPKLVAYGVLGMCNWLSRWYDPAKDIPVTEVIDTYFSMILNGISKT